MKIFLKVLKWIGLSIGSLLMLIILAGLVFRLFGPTSHPPMGEMVDIGDFRLHINCSGKKNDHPTLVIEGGAGSASEYYHWLSEGLKDSMRVVRYDRAGIGYSDASNTPRDPETIARELHTLLEKAGESPPYILAGHSLGGSYIRVFTQLYPDEVVAMALLDATHPERVERFNLPLASSWTFKLMIWSSSIQATLGDLGIMMLYDKLMGPIYSREREGLPDEINRRTIDYLVDGKYLRAYKKELAQYHSTLKRAGETTDFGSIPIRVFTAAMEIDPKAYETYLAKGIDLKQRRLEAMSMQKEYTDLSTNGQQILIDGNHSSIFTKKENADVICKEIIQLLTFLKLFKQD